MIGLLLQSEQLKGRMVVSQLLHPLSFPTDALFPYTKVGLRTSGETHVDL